MFRRDMIPTGLMVSWKEDNWVRLVVTMFGSVRRMVRGVDSPSTRTRHSV